MGPGRDRGSDRERGGVGTRGGRCGGRTPRAPGASGGSGRDGGSAAAWEGDPVQAPLQREQPRAGGPHARLHEPAGHGVQHVRADAEAEVVRLDRRLLLLHQLRQLPQLRGHQADDEQLHALHLGRGDVLPAEPTAHVPPVVTVAGGGDPRGVSGWGNKGVLRPSRGAWTVRGCWGHQGVLR